MFPIKLIIKGLYSYQQEQTIDFTKLTDGKLFGIFGPVGSGKSSILEAISYALYGETERLNNRDQRNYNMLNLKSGDLYIEFVFTAGIPEKIYKCIVSCKRNKKDFQNVSSIVRTGYELVGANWVPIEVTTLPDIIGLSYQNFRRTIIIPQGKFSEFLQLGDKDRTDMLKEIFSLDKFEYSEEVSFLEKKNAESIKVIEGKLEQIGEVSQEQIDEQTLLLKDLVLETEKLKDQLDEKVKEEKKLQELKELFGRLNESKKDLAELEEKKEFYKQLDKRIRNYELCLIEFKPFLDLKNQYERKLKIDQWELENLQIEKSKTEEKLKAAQEEFGYLEKKFQQKQELKARTEELIKVLRIKEIQVELGALKDRIRKGENMINQVQKNINRLQKEKEQLKNQVSLIKSQIPDLNVIGELRHWYSVNKGLEENIRRHKNHVDELERIIENHKRPCPITSGKLKAHFNGSLNGELSIDHVQVKKQEIYAEQERLVMQIEHLSIERKLEDFVLKLKENEPCPLCGSSHHPNKLSIESVSASLERLKIQKAELTEVNKEIDQWLNKEQERLNKIESYALPLKNERELLLKAEENLQIHLSQFVWKDFDPTSSQKVEMLIKSSKESVHELKKLEETIEFNSREIEKEFKKKEEYTTALYKLNLGLTQKSSEQKTYQYQVDHELLLSFSTKTAIEIEGEVGKLLKDYNLIVESYERLNASINNTRESIARIDGQVREKENSIEHSKKELEKALNSLEEKINTFSFNNLYKIEQILTDPLNLEEEKARLKDYADKSLLMKRQVDELTRKIKNQDYNEVEHNHLIELIERQTTLIAEAHKEAGRISSEIMQMEIRLKESLGLRKELKELHLRRDDINVMKNLFKGNGFVNYISSVFLRNLINAANERFYKLTRQKLRLELTDTNNFQVRDFLNNGQVRSVKTLSGGQTFQASLSLALSLAESIKQQNKSKQNFFFLDEGFGSLDKDSLEIVFDTLKSLRKEDRVVGVISHVRELQQEIDAYLEVSNNEEVGSIVRGSWERSLA
jgi:DNA repair protein SbcC/Rad50